MIALVATLCAASLVSLTASPAAAFGCASFGEGKRVEVKVQALNVRSGAGLKNLVLRVVSNGTRGTVTHGDLYGDGY